jgi:hypothetical protein
MKPAAYAAYTDACTFFLDEDGVCLRVDLTRRRPDERTLGGRTRARAAERCLGAQYVASIDPRAAGGLVAMPQVGAPLLFAYVGPDGRIAVVRTGALVHFERLESDPCRQTIQPDIEDTDESMTVPLWHSGELWRSSVPRMAALRRAAGMPEEKAPDRSGRHESIAAPRDTAPTWKDVQPAPKKKR